MALKYLYAPSGVKAGTAYGVIPNSASADFSSFVSDTDGTRVDKNGFITDVEANVPRIDYTGGGCPSLLLEEESTNYLKYSEDFSQGYWNKNQVVITSTDNISPDGTNNATLLTDDNSGGTSSDVGLNKYAFTLPSAGTYAFSVFAKKGTVKVVRISNGGYDTSSPSYFNLETGVVVSKGTNHETATIQEYKDGYYKIAITFETTTDLVGSFNFLMASDSSGAITKDGTNTVYVYGAQAEKLQYASSYIPNYGTDAGVTRSADAGGSTGDISSTINEEEGVFFAYMAAHTSEAIVTPQWITLSEGNSDNSYIVIRYSSSANTIQVRYKANGGSPVQISTTSVDRGNFNKVAFRWKSNDFSLWINGNLIETQTTWDIITANNLDRLRLSYPNASAIQEFFGKLKEIRIYDKYESDAEMAKLTTL